MDAAVEGKLAIPGDIVVAVDRGGEGNQGEVLRLRRARAVDGSERVLVRSVVAGLPDISGLAVSSDGRWLATVVSASEPGAGAIVRVRHLQSGGLQGDGPWWVSQPGCQGPVFNAAATHLYLSCGPRGRQPSSILELSLADRRTLAFVGERPRVLATVGVEGDLYWVEEEAGQSHLIRRPHGAVGYSTHSLYGRIGALWPQVDGSLVAGYGVPGAAPQLARLLPSGVVRNEPSPRVGVGSLPEGGPTHLTVDGWWLAAGCQYKPCTVVEVGPDGAAASPLHLSGLPTAITQVSRLRTDIGHVEDLATAPSSVLSSHSAAEVSVLGVKLKVPVETAFSTLDRAGRHPYWISAKGPRGRPGGVGVGWTSAGYCISFLSDDRGRVAAIELQGCAAEYLSPQLAPLLRREQLSQGALQVASRFLGPGVSVTLGGGEPSGRGLPIQRTRIYYEAPDRGYEFEAEIEVVTTRRSVLLKSRLLGGHVRFRLQTPSRPQASILGVP